MMTNLVSVSTSSLQNIAEKCDEKINAIYAVWSILTSSNAILKQWIGIPSSATLSSLADISCEKESFIRVTPSQELVTLSEDDKTLGLLLNAARMQATNFNWTFESVRATHGVGG